MTEESEKTTEPVMPSPREMLVSALVKFVQDASEEACEAGYDAGDASAEEVWAAVNAEGNASHEAAWAAGYAAGNVSVERAEIPPNKA